MAEYYVVRDKNTGLYFRGKGVNRWGKHYNQASIYRIKANAENTIKEVSWRGEQAEVVPIQIVETTADVVPKSEVDSLKAELEDRVYTINSLGEYLEKSKSEVERLEEELDDFTVASLAECKACGEKTSKVIEGLQKRLANAKAEVAMEIFAELHREIEAALRSNYDALRVHDDGRANDYVLELVNRIKGKIDALRGIDGFVEELEKKYTGDQT